MNLHFKFTFLFFLLLSGNLFSSEAGFLNIVNGTDQPLEISIDQKVAFKALEPKGMTGGMMLQGGKQTIDFTSDSLGKLSSPLTLGPNDSQVIIVTKIPSKDDPQKERLKIQSVPRVNNSETGMTAGVIYAGREAAVTLKISNKELFLEKYKHVNLGAIPRSFTVSNQKGAQYQTDFRESIHYTLVIFDEDPSNSLEILIVPHISYKEPTF